MRATDFEYDNNYLSDFGFVICDFDGKSDVETVSPGSEIEFNMVSPNNGKHSYLTSTSYKEGITAEFDIMKNTCESDDLIITDEEFRTLMRWLNRREFLKFRLIDEEDDIAICYFNASFNINKLVVEDRLIGLRLTATTDKPYGYGSQILHKWDVTTVPFTDSIYDMSDEIGDTYPLIEVTVNQAGNFEIQNVTTGRSTIIKNCSANEKIVIDNENKIITSDKSTHKIYNDFNFKFFKLVNTFNERENEIKVTLPCHIEISYYPIIKNGIE